MPHPFEADELTRGLACAALTPALRRVLLFDASPAAFFAAAGELELMLEAVTGQTYRRVILGSVESEDDLWTTLDLKSDAGGPHLLLTPGRLATPPNDPRPVLVLIPDLANLALNAARACVALMGEGEMATLQRHGLDYRWRKEMCWLARIARAEVGEPSQHLLDRFVLRLPSREEQPPPDRVAVLMALAGEPATETALRAEPLSYELASALRAARVLTPDFPADDIERVLLHFGSQNVEGMRRPLALARLSRTMAQLAGATLVSAAHVGEAAQLIGLQVPSVTTLGAETEAETEPAFTPAALELPKEEEATQGSPVAAGVAPRVVSEETSDGKVLKSDTELTFEAAPIVSSPYPEDMTPPAHEADSLQFPSRCYRPTGAPEGPVIGTQPARDLGDIALVSTVVEAAKFQKLRANGEPGARFIITRADLRSYRRVPMPEQMLMLLIDYTSLRGRKWQAALWPYLRWAYVARASVTIVQVGFGAPRGDALRAELVKARSLLSQQVRDALNGRSGTATPLAHGLDLAARTLRTALQHGRGRTQLARLVVLSDARGNVPLAASRAGRFDRAVGRQGIDDALKAARDLRTLNSLDIYFLNTQPEQYPELPAMLAEALGAVVEDVPLEEPF